ncbi:hypothetical protein N866_17355 [Actinotalea ferrariae CF5-4]|uniref:Uncharacterized protein n=1 Tax=Actinotalea ferrariae CF5-4 TaxID=948458 RepID=A0A021VRY4_9CELL|nr:hypothetical protein [Actinotalea ferrariae]EYR63906.1 hypothetical protein N866_17355 [Actinotalea ferrariae CF5-4]
MSTLDRGRARAVPVPLHPHALRVDGVAAMLNAELADDPVYDGIELQRFDDDVHGTGMLVFLSRRDDRTVDYYAEPGLRLDRAGYRIGAGTRSWTETDLGTARLDVLQDGVVAAVRFTDVDGRLVEVDVDDRDGRPRRRARLLAPVSAGIDRPCSLLLVWLGGFDLVRVTARRPVIRIDGRTASTGRLPGVRLHHRHLIKYAAPLCSVELNRDAGGPAGLGGPHEDAGGDDARADAGAATGRVEATADGTAVRRITAARAPHTAAVTFEPPFPDLRALAPGDPASGRWWLEADGARLTGGAWSAARADDVVDVALDVHERWRPGRLPLLMRVVTAVVPVFRRWPTTYAWRATVDLGNPQQVSGGWHRTGGQDGAAYRRATGS